VICRGWENRVKGRDLYDYIFYLSQNTPVNVKHLRERLIQSKFASVNSELSINDIKKILISRFDEIDYEQAKADVEPFIKNNRSLSLWKKDFFVFITEQLAPV